MYCGQAGDGAGDLANHVVAGVLAGVVEHFLADRLDLIHVKAERHQVRAEHQQAAAAHRAGAGAHQAADHRPHALPAGGRAGSDDRFQLRRLGEQNGDGVVRGFAGDEVEHQRHRLARNVRFRADGRGDAGNQGFHVGLPMRRPRPRALHGRVCRRAATKSSAVKSIRAHKGGYDLEKGRRRGGPAARNRRQPFARCAAPRSAGRPIAPARTGSHEKCTMLNSR